MKRLYRFPMRSSTVARLVPVLILATVLCSMLPAFSPPGGHSDVLDERHRGLDAAVVGVPGDDG